MTQRLSNAKEVASKPAGLQSHEDLARKLQVCICLKFNDFSLDHKLIIFMSIRLSYFHELSDCDDL